MPAPQPLPSSVPTAAFAVRDAHRWGVGRERLRRSDLDTPFRGVRSVSTPSTVVERCTALRPIMRADAFFCGPTAALLWGIPVPWRLESDIRVHVALPHGRRPSRLRGVAGHHYVITSAEQTTLAGLPITTPARTWCDLAAWLTMEELVASGDRVIWEREPLASHADLAHLAARHPGRRGLLTRRSALGRLSPLSDSPAESLMRVRFEQARLPRATPNHPVLRPDGSVRARIDLAFVAYRVGVEYEGDHHRTDRRQWQRDIRRFSELDDDGWSMIRATGDDLIESGPLIERVARRLRDRGWNP